MFAKGNNTNKSRITVSKPALILSLTFAAYFEISSPRWNRKNDVPAQLSMTVKFEEKQTNPFMYYYCCINFFTVSGHYTFFCGRNSTTRKATAGNDVGSYRHEHWITCLSRYSRLTTSALVPRLVLLPNVGVASDVQLSGHQTASVLPRERSIVEPLQSR